MTWLPIIFSLVISLLGYQLPLPGIYQVGHEMVITAECGCEFRDIEPVEFSNVVPESRTIVHGLPTTLNEFPKSSPSPNTIRCPNRLPRRGYFPQPRVAASAATLGDRPTNTPRTL